MAEDFKMPFLLWMFTSMVALVCGQQPPLLPPLPPLPELPSCLTGTMIDVQSWVTENGELTSSVDKKLSLDLSAQPKPTGMIEQSLASAVRSSKMNVKYLSLARNHLTRLPASIFDEFYEDEGWNLSKTVEYLTLYGNRFIETSVPGENYDEFFNATRANEINTGIIHRVETRAMWSVGFQRVAFTSLRELDLRACGISTLDSYIFRKIPQLEALYLSDNSITVINSNAFAGIPKLIHLDLSRNIAIDNQANPKFMTIETDDAFAGLRNLRSLDFSYTKLNPRRMNALRGVGRQLERLSLCNSGPFSLEPGIFENTSLKILDVSGNHRILENEGALSGLEDTLIVLYASEVGLKTFEIFDSFRKLEILKLDKNEIVGLKNRTAGSLTSLQAVDLRRNRLTNWSKSTFSHMISLKLLDLRSNTINIINREMIRDIRNVTFLGLSGNPMVCNCNAKEFIEIAARNEMSLEPTSIKPLKRGVRSEFNFHTAFKDVNSVISGRTNVSQYVPDNLHIELKAEGNFVLVDYDRDAYSCLSLTDSKTVPFEEVLACTEPKKEIIDKLTQSKMHLLALIVIPGLLLPALFIGYIYRRNLRYFYVMMRNSAMLSMVNENNTNDDTIYNYDVFVSYCNEDRPWVLDQLLSHLENDCSVSLCLHERDFQVGLTILENIVSCMDRSKSIMLVISKQFLRSQWCQFEMHLAQHRLLETRREDLILILLEDIPRRLRPNTLHYLMLTKTYIVWPKTKYDQEVFWKRLKKSVTMQRQRENRVSLA